MANFDQLPFHDAPDPCEQRTPRKPTPIMIELAAQKEALYAQIEAQVKDVEALLLQDDNVNPALLWEAARTLQGTKFYDAFVALLQKHNVEPL